MLKLCALILMLSFGFASSIASADCGHSGNIDYCGPELIQLLYVTASGAVYVQMTSPLTPPPAGFLCSPVAGTYLLLNAQAPNFKQLYAALLSARMTGAAVTVVLDPTQSQCTISYVTV